MDTSESARGLYGLYRTVLSQEIEVVIKNPCDRSIVNEDGALAIEALTVPVGKELLELNYQGPTDSASVTYGDSDDKCGPFEYSYIFNIAPDWLMSLRD